MVYVDPCILDWIYMAIPRDILTKATIIEIEYFRKNEIEIDRLKKLSAKLDIPFGYFFLSDSPIENLPDLEFLKKIDKPYPRNIIYLIYDLENLQDYLKINNTRLPLYRSCVSFKDVDKIVETIYNDLYLDYDWKDRCNSIDDIIECYREVLDYNGIVTIRTKYLNNNYSKPIDSKLCKSFVLLDPVVPIIYLNRPKSMTGVSLRALINESIKVGLGQEHPLHNEVLRKIFETPKKYKFSDSKMSIKYRQDPTSQIVKTYMPSTIFEIDSLVHSHEITYLDAYRLFDQHGQGYTKLVNAAKYYNGECNKRFDQIVRVTSSRMKNRKL
jgi:transcriptional regulator with XRE-family HTH domain